MRAQNVKTVTAQCINKITRSILHKKYEYIVNQNIISQRTPRRARRSAGDIFAAHQDSGIATTNNDDDAMHMFPGA